MGSINITCNRNDTNAFTKNTVSPAKKEQMKTIFQLLLLLISIAAPAQNSVKAPSKPNEHEVREADIPVKRSNRQKPNSVLTEASTTTTLKSFNKTKVATKRGGERSLKILNSTPGLGQSGNMDSDSWNVGLSGKISDSTTDVSNIISAAFVNPLGHKKIYFPKNLANKGIFSVTNIIVPKGITLYSDKDVVIKGMKTQGPILKVVGDDVNIIGLKFNGNNISFIGIQVSTRVRNTRIESCEIYNIRGRDNFADVAKAILLDSSVNTTIRRSYIHDISSPFNRISRAIYVSSSTGTIVQNNTFDRITPFEEGDAVHFHAWFGQDGIYGSLHGIIEGNYFFNTAKRAIKIQASDVLIKDNFVSSTATDLTECPFVGIEIIGGRNNRIINNKVDLKRAIAGIDATNSVNCIISGNTIFNDSARAFPRARTGTGSLTGIFLTNSKNITVSNNIIKTKNFGIALMHDTLSDIHDNLISKSDTLIKLAGSRLITIRNNTLKSIKPSHYSLYVNSASNNDSLRIVGNKSNNTNVVYTGATLTSSEVNNNSWNKLPASYNGKKFRKKNVQ